MRSHLVLDYPPIALPSVCQWQSAFCSKCQADWVALSHLGVVPARARSRLLAAAASLWKATGNSR
jgi:hypothetical protein